MTDMTYKDAPDIALGIARRAHAEAWAASITATGVAMGAPRGMAGDPANTAAFDAAEAERTAFEALQGLLFSQCGDLP